tara:strand:+ start:1685 stop:2182 length:498 start_codon:yes stop_codon:yes gene_type:complete
MNIIKNFFEFKKQNFKRKENSYQEEVDQYIQIANLIKDARISQNLTIEELALISKIPERTIYSLENNDKDSRPNYPFIRSILIKLEKCLELKQNTLIKLVNRRGKPLKKNGNTFVLSKYDLLNTWQGSFLYFLILILTIFILKRYLISNVNVIEIQNIEIKNNEK